MKKREEDKLFLVVDKMINPVHQKKGKDTKNEESNKDKSLSRTAYKVPPKNDKLGR